MTVCTRISITRVFVEHEYQLHLISHIFKKIAISAFLTNTLVALGILK